MGDMSNLIVFSVCLFVMAVQSVHSEQQAIVMVIHLSHAADDGPKVLQLLEDEMSDQVHVLHAGRNGTFSLLLEEELQEQMIDAIQPFELNTDGITIQRVEDIQIEHGWKHERRNKRSIEEFQLESYNTHASIKEYLNKLAEAYPEICETEVIGRTFEGNDITAVKIHGYNSTADKVRILLDGTQHAREWISPAVLVFIINKLVTQYSENDSWAVELLDKYEFHIVPVVNVDGYEYSHNSSSARFWRKNRRPNDDGLCIGVDLNRNWGFHWSGLGGSQYECSAIYYGKSEFSEPETRAVADYIDRYNGTWHSYFTFHSYGQMILFPWSHSAMQSPDHIQHQEAGEKMAEGIKKVYNTTVYRVGSVAKMLYAASGSAESWAYGRGNFPYSYTIELPDLYHFVIPKRSIAPASLEILSGLKSYLSYIEGTRPELYYQLLEQNQMLMDDDPTTTSTVINTTTDAATAVFINATHSMSVPSIPSLSSRLTTPYFSLTTRSRPPTSLFTNSTQQQATTTPLSLKPTTTDSLTIAYNQTIYTESRNKTSNLTANTQQVTTTPTLSTTTQLESFQNTLPNTTYTTQPKSTIASLTQNTQQGTTHSVTLSGTTLNGTHDDVTDTTSTAQYDVSTQNRSLITQSVTTKSKLVMSPPCGAKCKKSSNRQDQQILYTSTANYTQPHAISIYLYSIYLVIFCTKRI